MAPMIPQIESVTLRRSDNDYRRPQSFIFNDDEESLGSVDSEFDYCGHASPILEPKRVISLTQLPTMRLKKNVRFAEQATVHSVLHRLDFEPEEIRASWYSGAELKLIKKDNRAAVQRHVAAIRLQQEKQHQQQLPHQPQQPQGNDIIEPDELCIRGLESKTTRGSTQKRQNKENARSAVLGEQKRQRMSGIADPEAIADAYFDCTDHCQAVANMIGLRDEREAIFLYGKDEALESSASCSSRIVLRSVLAQEQHRPVVVSSSAA